MAYMEPTEEFNRPTGKTKKVASLQDEDIYEMDNNPCGYCVIINITKDLSCAMIDEKCMQELFQDLHYETKVIRDKSHEDIAEELINLSTSIPKEHKSVVVIVNAHGTSIHNVNYFQDINGEISPSSYVLNAFDAENCTSLVGRPKVFIIDTCLGDKVMGGAPRTKSVALPKRVAHEQSDFLVYHATTFGHTSHYDHQKGSYVIQAINKIFREHAAGHDLLQLLTKVNREIAKDALYRKKTKEVWQQPSIAKMTLNKLFYFNTEYERTHESTVSMEDESYSYDFDYQ